jgi:hypothetical protein
MRRGLLKWDPQELPLEVLEGRIGKLRAAMKAAGLDAFIAYTNLVRPAAVNWLSGFTPYWSEGLLMVPPDGRLIFATALSNRVADWIRSTNPVSDVVSTPRPGARLGEWLVENASAQRVGVLEFDAMPWELASDLAAAAPMVHWEDASAMFAAVRGAADPTEERLLARADALAVAALAEAERASVKDAGALSGLVEQHARLAGAEEAYIAVAPDLRNDSKFNRISKPVPLGPRFAVRASIAYKGCWVRRVRTFGAGEAGKAADAWLGEVAMAADKPIGKQIEATVARLAGAALKSWMVEGASGSYPLAAVASSRSRADETAAAGRAVVLTVELLLGGEPWIGAAPLIVGRQAR